MGPQEASQEVLVDHNEAEDTAGVVEDNTTEEDCVGGEISVGEDHEVVEISGGEGGAVVEDSTTEEDRLGGEIFVGEGHEVVENPGGEGDAEGARGWVTMNTLEVHPSTGQSSSFRCVCRNLLIKFHGSVLPEWKLLPRGRSTKRKTRS